MVMEVGEVYDSNRYGQMQVLKYENAGKVLVEFIDTRYTKYAEARNIRRGEVKDLLAPSVYGVGYLGEGVHGSSHPGHKTWSNMLMRCYPYTSWEYPNYTGCTVAEEWHCFQTFAIWYDKHYISGYELDKDTKILGNLIYGPDTCVFIRKADNVVAARARSYNILFNGEAVEVYNLLEFCRENHLKYQGVYYSVTKGKKIVDVKKYLM